MNQEILKEITECAKLIKEGGYIIFPSELGWAIGCDAANSEKINALANSEFNLYKALLLSDTGKLTRYLKEIPEVAWNLVEFTMKPLHLEFDYTLSGEAGFVKDKETVTFRIAKDDFTLGLLNKLNKPLFAAILPIQTQPSKINSILNSNCYVVNLRTSAKANTDNLTVIKFFDGGKFEFIKK